MNSTRQYWLFLQKLTLTFIYISFPVVMLIPVMFGGEVEAAAKFITIAGESIRDIWSNGKHM